MSNDLISRQALIEHLRRTIEASSNDGDYNEGFNDGMDFSASFASTLPSVQPETHEKRTETHGVCLDAISRQDAIDLVSDMLHWDHYDRATVEEAVAIIRDVASVQPEPERNTASEQPVSDRLWVKTCKTCTDTISRQDAIDALKGLPSWWRFGWILDPEDAISAIGNLPSAQPERKTGRWEFQGDRMYLCTCCCYLASQEQLKSWKSKTTDRNFPPYCPNCGAEMRGDKDD